MTALVHLRQPVAASRQMGFAAALALLVQLPLSLLSITAHPVCLALVAWGALDGSLWRSSGSAAGDAVLAVQAATLCVGYAAAFALHLAVLRRRPCRCVGVWLVPLLPFYWLLTSWALAVGLSDLAVRPHRWAKTAHGVVARPNGAPAVSDPRHHGLSVQPTGE